MGKKVKLGLIGLGGRGMGLLKLVFVHHEDVEFAAVCDVQMILPGSAEDHSVHLRSGNPGGGRRGRLV